MDANQIRPALVATDTNVLLDLAEEVEDVRDAVLLIRRRLHQTQLLFSPTVREELAKEALHADDLQQRDRAMRAFQLARDWDIRPVEFVQAQDDIARRIGSHLRRIGLLPQAELNDGLVLAEAALLNCSILLTSDEHLRGIDFERLTFELRAFDVTAPVIATPREVVKKFFR